MNPSWQQFGNAVPDDPQREQSPHQRDEPVGQSRDRAAREVADDDIRRELEVKDVRARNDSITALDAAECDDLQRDLAEEVELQVDRLVLEVRARCEAFHIVECEVDLLESMPQAEHLYVT
jgi:hypothetical protein